VNKWGEYRYTKHKGTIKSLDGLGINKNRSISLLCSWQGFCAFYPFKTDTVKPALRGYLWDKEKVAF
jgi:hypothetical protein